MLTTRRLTIRPIEKIDYDDICEYGCDEETGQYMVYWPKTKEQIEKYIDDCIDNMNSTVPTELIWYEYVMELKEDKKVIGNISLKARGTEAELGWISNRNYWNNGYMTEAVNAIIEYAFDNLGIKRIFAICTDQNIASFKVMEKCNMNMIRSDNNYKSYRRGIEVTYNRLTYCIEG